MASGFSGHLVDSFLQAQPPRGPFGQPAPQVTASGPLSFAPTMHGTFANFGTQASMSFSESSFMDLSEESSRKIAAMQAKLDKKLGPEYISQRPGPGGGPKLTYAEGWKIINLANEVFGFNGWSSSVVSLTTDYIDVNEQSQRFNVGVTAIVRVTLRDGVFHEDIGYGILENAKSKGAALDKCKKEAVTDGVKRALRNFGNLLGNCLYDKSYAQEIVKIKVPPPKFDKSDLHRRPEFEERKPDTGMDAPAKMQSAASASGAGPSAGTARPDTFKAIDTPHQQISKPISAVPPHLRTATSGSSSSTTKAKSLLGPAEYPTSAADRTMNQAGPSKTGLNTPIHTPNHGAAAARGRSTSDLVHEALGQPKSYQPAVKTEPAPQAARTNSQKERKISSLEAQIAQALAAENPAPALAAAEEDADLVPALSGSYDEYGLNSEDDAFFATVDLGEGDSGVGGHIDFDEGTRPAAESFAEDNSAIVSPQPPIQKRQPTTSRVPNVVASSDSSRLTLPRTSTQSMGGFHFPPGIGPETFNSGSARLKRSADTMQEARRPMQGMGLSHKSAGTTAGSSRREPLATLDVAGGGDAKRMRR